MTSKPWSRAIGCLVLVSAGSASAVVPAAEPEMVTVDRAPRVHRNVAWQRDAVLAGWTAIYDHDTGVPVRWWGPGPFALGATRDPAAAEAWARAFLVAHLDVLAPGAVAADFVIVANQLDGELRSVGFAQHAGGVPVRGGTISFGFKRDRLIMVGSTALPDVRVAPVAAQRLAAPRVASAAVAWLATSGRAVAAQGSPARLIVPIIRDRSATGALDITYHLAEQITVTATRGEPGQWNVFVDAATGAAFARESTLSYATGSVLFDVPDRAPMAAAGRHPQPAGDAIHNVDGVDVTANLDGVVSWSGGGPAHVAPGLTGPRVRIVNRSGDLTSGNLMLPPDGTCTWSHPTDEKVDAQIDAFIYANQAKQFARTHLAPNMAFLDNQLDVFVNEAGTCNAYSQGDGLHFFVQTEGRCENTGRMADVVYHELGHSLHHQAIIPGVGVFNSSMSEGAADTFAVAITGDPAVGRGFYFDNRPLRDLAPVGAKKHWPEDVTGESHSEGEIYGQTMWDLRTALEAALGRDAGFTQFLKVYWGTLQRAVDIPSSFAEALVSDDDDGDLTNGTPNDCAIIRAFSAHGLFDPGVTGGVAPPARDGYQVSIAGASAAATSCHTPSVTAGTMSWRRRGGELETMPLAAAADGSLQATIPTQPDRAVVEYKVEVTLSNGVVQSFPLNPADPLYQFSVGTPTPIWCADFEAGADDWTHLTMPAEKDQWQVGPPSGQGGDPVAAHTGHNVFGVALTGGGRYASAMTTLARSPGVDLKGYANVHLQYYRWLGVEDGWNDHASVMANNVTLWNNLASEVDPQSAGLNHVDHEWRFQDLDVTGQTSSGNIQLTFTLTSDPNGQYAGWNLDDVCLVGWSAMCGNSIREAGEKCDDGNTRDGDGCSSSCQSELTPDEPDRGGGCNAGGGAGVGVLLALGLLRRGRRRI